ncbi:Sensors of blue-light using FAD [Paucidesulfovibrio gracilis DSM 16080]|uniref:Sensors of blue-light using FAD n=1 Tax=Paucidesulfovibrio gracilis DSM 16080 TaxID=1121449 RepID=A0A1T4Y466_9BACT|nr:BLUF domain-containing protein [Paucidesulfovibrio gracilis]SKA96550.1 Sensors of blue-light using FAD [Paucidesulfovibrio gracilis DSM 16080]
MHMVRLLYASRPSEDFCSRDLDDILEESRKLNKRDHITGVLCHSETSFLQWIEGPRESVNALYNRLQRHPKHTDLLLLEYAYIHRRDFADWSMAAVATDNIPLNLLQRFTVLERYDPFTMSGDAARIFLLDVSREGLPQADGQG